MRPTERAGALPVERRERPGDARLILLMRGLRSFAYGLLAVILGIVLAGEGFSPAAIGVLITVSLVGDMAGTYVIALVADSWGRRRTLALLSLLMAATGVVFGLVSSYPVLLFAAFFGTLGTSASETAPFLPIDQAMIAQVTAPERRTALFARYNLVASLSAALGALAAGLPALLTRTGLPVASGIRLLFGMYAVLGLVVAGLSLRLASPVEAPARPAIQVHSLRQRLAPQLHRSLSIMLSACDQGSGSATGTPTPPAATATTATIQLGPQPCPAAVQAPAHWNAVVGASATNVVEGVICGYLMGVPALQAVVKVRHGGANVVLDIGVYTAITSAKPVRIFALTWLLQGDSSISNYNTLLTGQVDPNSSQNTGHPAVQQVVDLYREFKWSDSAGTLTQVAFQGLYPDLTRFQAEFEQHEVNTGQGLQQWRLSAVTTAQNFAQFVLGWDPTSPTTVVSGGGTHDARAVVLIKNPAAGGATITLSLSRLELNTNGGIWEVTGVATDGMALTSPQSLQQLTSPVQVAGSTAALAGKPTTITVFDHDRAAIGQATLTQASGAGNTPFAMHVPYASSFQSGAQEGIIVLYRSTGNHIIAGAVMVKVLLSA